MAGKRFELLKNRIRQNGTHIHAGVIVTVMAFIGFVGVYGIRAATYATNTQAESGTLSGNAALSGDTTASGGNSVAFGKTGTPSTPTGLKTFTGGTSIAIRWSGSTVNGSTIKQYNVLRNGVQVASITPGFHADFPEKDGNGYIDSNVTRGATYSYQVQAVSTANTTSALSSSVSATHPTSTTPTPTFTYNVNGATDLDDYMKNMVIPFLKIWYPKVADADVFPDYTPYTTINLVLDANNTNILDTYLTDGHITANTGFIRSNYLTSPDRVLGGWLHEATHSIQGQATTAGNNGQSWAIEGGADFSREFLLHDRDSGRPDQFQYYSDGYGPGSYFMNWIQTNLDSTYVRKVTVHGHNNTFSAADLQFSNGKTVDEAWAQMLGFPAHTGALTSQGTSKCLDGQNSGTLNGTALQIYSCLGNINQKVTVQPNNDGTASIHLLGNCIDVANGGTTSGTLVWLYGCGVKNPSQSWIIKSDGTVVNPQSGLCLSIKNSGNGGANGTGMEIATCTGGSWQKWNIPSSSPKQAQGQISFKSSAGQCLEDPAGNTAATTRFQIAACNGLSAQKWTLNTFNGNTVLAVAGLCMDITNGGSADGTGVWLYTCSGNFAQIWQIQPNGSLKNPNSGKCLDTTNSTTSTGVQFVINTCNGSSSQLFTFPS